MFKITFTEELVANNETVCIDDKILEQYNKHKDPDLDLIHIMVPKCSGKEFLEQYTDYDLCEIVNIESCSIDSHGFG